MNATCLIDNKIVLKESKFLTMAKTISKKISVKASSSKPSGKPLPVDKTLGLDTAIRFCEI